MVRKLTQQQKRRIQATQDQRQVTLEQDTNLSNGQKGLLLMRHGRSALVENELGEIISCHLRQNLKDMVAGDNVIWQPDEAGGGVIISVLPRVSMFRKILGTDAKVIAANISCLLIVLAPEPVPTPGLIDKFLLAAEIFNLKVLLIVNKADLTIPSQLQAQLAIYEALNYPILYISNKTKQGIPELIKKLQSETSLFVGQSGVGKSSLINSLLPEDIVRVQAISSATHFGRHTTSAARLYHLPTGGYLIDTAGVRDIEIGPLKPVQLLQGFKECQSLIGLCKFRDCHHENEPNCAIKQAVSDNKMQAQRYNLLILWLKQLSQ